MMYCMDTNSFITAWHIYYPPLVFPSLWQNIVAQRNNFIIIKPIYDEIEPINSGDIKELREELLGQKPLGEKSTRERLLKVSPVKLWLYEENYQFVNIDDDVEALSLDLEKKYEIPRNNQRGAGKNDITLIAYAKIHNIPVVTFEGKQNKERPKKKNHYKIPLICQDENVECIILPECLKRLGITI